MTLQAELKYGEQYLKEHGVEEAGTDAWLLFQYATGMDRTRFLMDRSEEMEEGPKARYRELLERRGERIPLQHLTGEQEFMGLVFGVNEDVLIPRQDTEILVEEALKRLNPGMRALDMCTGSGCIAISLAKLRRKEDYGCCAGPDMHLKTAVVGSGPEQNGRNTGTITPLIDGADISGRALALAEKNAELLGADVRFLQSDLFGGISDVYDMIVSNPPYIPTQVIGELSPEVRLHEPLTALDGHGDGLYFYREIIRESRGHLASGGWILFEIGCDQGEDVAGMLREAGYTDVCIVKDLAGLDRVVLGRSHQAPLN